jgi:hypothetical protein
LAGLPIGLLKKPADAGVTTLIASGTTASASTVLRKLHANAKVEQRSGNAVLSY